MDALIEAAYSVDKVRQLSLAELKRLRATAKSPSGSPRTPLLAKQERGAAIPLSYGQERLFFWISSASLALLTTCHPHCA